MNTLQVGEQFKVLEVIGVPNSDMPLHYCTSEAVLIIHVGRAILTMDNFEKEMKLGMSVIIPAKKEHSLKIIDSVKAYVVIARDATIEFAQ